MYVILDGEAQFTIDGRTSLLKAPVGAPCRLGHSHALYNPTDKPVQFLNVNVSMLKGENDAFNTDDPRVDVALDRIPVFMTMSLDRALLKPVTAMFGGKGAVQYRRAIPPSLFAGPWAFTDHLLIPPGIRRAADPSRRGEGVLRDGRCGYRDRGQRNGAHSGRRRNSGATERGPLVPECRDGAARIVSSGRLARTQQGNAIGYLP